MTSDDIIEARALISGGDAHLSQAGYDAAIADFTSVVKSYSANIDPAMRIYVEKARELVAVAELMKAAH